MRAAQFTVDEILAVLRRRRKLFFLPIIVVSTVCTLGAFLLPRKYDSSTTILVERDEVLNPLISFTMAVTMASEDRLRSLNEIIFSRATVEALIDTLGLSRSVLTEADKQELIKKFKKNIETGQSGSDSFTLTYTDEDPLRAQRGVQFLANHFIRTRLRVENERNENAVRFFEAKLDDVREKFESSQRELVSLMRQRITEMPSESRTLYTRLDESEKEIDDIDATSRTYARALQVLQQFPQAFRSEAGTKQLYDLQREELPFAEELSALMSKYEEATRRYTDKYPEVQKLQTQILDVLKKMKAALQMEIGKQRTKRWDLEKARNHSVQEIQHSSVASKVDQETQSNYGIYQKLYEDMKIKLEQARTSRDLGTKGAQQFIIIDPARIPTEPSRPNRPLIIAGGVSLGLFLGMLSAMVAELLDTRVKTMSDVERYRKPVIAFLPDGEAGIAL